MELHNLLSFQWEMEEHALNVRDVNKLREDGWMLNIMLTVYILLRLVLVAWIWILPRVDLSRRKTPLLGLVQWSPNWPLSIRVRFLYFALSAINRVHVFNSLNNLLELKRCLTPLCNLQVYDGRDKNAKLTRKFGIVRQIKISFLKSTTHHYNEIHGDYNRVTYCIECTGISV